MAFPSLLVEGRFHLPSGGFKVALNLLTENPLLTLRTAKPGRGAAVGSGYGIADRPHLAFRPDEHGVPHALMGMVRLIRVG